MVQSKLHVRQGASDDERPKRTEKEKENKGRKCSFLKIKKDNDS